MILYEFLFLCILRQISLNTMRFSTVILRSHISVYGGGLEDPVFFIPLLISYNFAQISLLFAYCGPCKYAMFFMRQRPISLIKSGSICKDI